MQLCEQINRALALRGLPLLSPDDVDYCQGKQYGQKGCGVTASINIHRILRQPEFFDHGIFEFSDQQVESDSTANHNKATVKSVTDKGKKKSTGGSFIEELLLRAELFLTMRKRYEVKAKHAEQLGIPHAFFSRSETAIKELERSPRFIKTKAANDPIII